MTYPLPTLLHHAATRSKVMLQGGTVATLKGIRNRDGHFTNQARVVLDGGRDRPVPANTIVHLFPEEPPVAK